MTVVVVVCSHSHLWALVDWRLSKHEINMLGWMCPLKREQATIKLDLIVEIGRKSSHELRLENDTGN